MGTLTPQTLRKKVVGPGGGGCDRGLGGHGAALELVQEVFHLCLEVCVRRSGLVALRLVVLLGLVFARLKIAACAHGAL